MRTLKQYALILLLSFAALNEYALKRYDLPYPFPLGPQFDNVIRQNHTKAIDETAPEIVLIGDSTLTMGVDPKQFAALTGKSVYSIDLPGSASTLWYLIIKNNIMQSARPPQTLIVFFRDTTLTMPEYRVLGQYFEQIDEYANKDDVVLIERAFINPMSPLEKFAEAYIPAYSARWQMREQIEETLRARPAALAGCNADCVNSALAKVFNQSNTNVLELNQAISAADENLYTRRKLDFNARVDESFLPEIIKLANQKNMRLIFVRIKTMQFTGPFPALDAYMSSLQTYAEKHNAILLDFGKDPRLTPPLFMDVLHLNENGKMVFTNILAEAVTPILP